MRADQVTFTTQPNPPSAGCAIVLLCLIAAALVATVLWLRPQSDALTIIGSVGAMLAAGFSALGYVQAKQTHLSVNSRLDAWVEASGKVARHEGVVQGAADEVQRAKQAADQAKGI